MYVARTDDPAEATRFRSQPGQAFPAAEVNAIPAPHPRGYMFGTNVSTMTTDVLPADQQAAARAGTLEPRDVTDMSPSWAWAAGGAISTAGDLASWAKALVEGAVLNPAWQRRRLDSILPTDPAVPRDMAVQIVACLVDGLMLEAVSNAELSVPDLTTRLRLVLERLCLRP